MWFSEQLGKNTSTISQWCSNKIQPSLEILDRIAKLLDIDNGILNCESYENITLDRLNGSSVSIFPNGTLLIAMYRATAGKLSILKRSAATNQAVCGIFENVHIETEYLFYYLLSQRQKMIDDSWGMSQPNISQTYLKAFIIPIPPYEEQKK